MGWFFTERRGPAWKQGWAEQTLSSVSAPPLPLVAIFGIIFLLFWLSSYINYKLQMQHTMINLKVFLLFLPVLLIFAVQLTESFRPKTYRRPADVGSNFCNLPWSVMVLVVLLLVMVSYHSHVQSMWTPSV
ncbi:uncharacterized protein LOC116141909 [Pistacia vera]|uniref:uncharacterized protein LOC116141909 n=1 Tax=Pistacia vera TaxID=55513 RepID=UPI001263B9A2|nr:uncharacterized protein LOC116141909 [Pistacia vera]